MGSRSMRWTLYHWGEVVMSQQQYMNETTLNKNRAKKQVSKTDTNMRVKEYKKYALTCA